MLINATLEWGVEQKRKYAAQGREWRESERERRFAVAPIVVCAPNHIAFVVMRAAALLLHRCRAYRVYLLLICTGRIAITILSTSLSFFFKEFNLVILFINAKLFIKS